MAEGGMTKREVVRAVLEHRRPPYVPWSFGFTQEAGERIAAHFGAGADLEKALGNHLLNLGAEVGVFTDLGGDLVRDVFGVTWDRRIDRDIGNVRGAVLPEPTLHGYRFPDPRDDRFFAGIPERIACHGDRFRVFQVGFSLFERAWTLRGGLERLILDFYDHPRFVRELLAAIADHQIAQVRRALEYDIDAVYFGDDWGQQRGLLMGPALWRAFILPQLARMYAVVKEAGRFVFIHSCGDVDELFDELIAAGLDCFNPFQPEVMDTDRLLGRYRSRLSFFGGLSTQHTLPYGRPEEVRAEARRLLKLGAGGGYIFAPAHAVEGDVPLENMLAFIEAAQAQAR